MFLWDTPLWLGLTLHFDLRHSSLTSLRSKILRLEWSVFVQLLKPETWDVTFDSSYLLCCPRAWIHKKEENMGQTLRKANNLRSRRRIFKRRREGEMGWKLGMLPEASLKWRKRVLRSTECHQIPNQLIFVLMGDEKGNNFLETQYLKTGSWGKSIWVREYISHSPVEAKASCLLVPAAKYIQKWEMSDEDCN